MKNQYKASKSRHSEHYGYDVFFTLKRKKFLGFIPYWVINDGPIKDVGQKDEIVMLLNNPDEVELRLDNAIKQLKK